MQKKILVIIGGRGIGDLIYHLPLLNSLYESYKSKLLILSNNINQSKEVFKYENFYEKIIEFDNSRFPILKAFKKVIKFTSLINSFKADQVILTSNTTRLKIPVMLSNIKDKIIFGTEKFFINKDKALNNLNFSEKIVKCTNDLNLPIQKKQFFLNQNLTDFNFKEIDKKIFINLDSHHDQNNWGIKNFIKIIDALNIRNKHIFINFSPNKTHFLKYFSKNLLFSKNISFTHKNTISEVIQIIQSCDVVIGNETGPICLASSLRKKVHSIYLPFHTKPESQIINKEINHYNASEISDENLIKKILTSVKD